MKTVRIRNKLVSDVLERRTDIEVLGVKVNDVVLLVELDVTETVPDGLVVLQIAMSTGVIGVSVGYDVPSLVLQGR